MFRGAKGNCAKAKQKKVRKHKGFRGNRHRLATDRQGCGKVRGKAGMQKGCSIRGRFGDLGQV